MSTQEQQLDKYLGRSEINFFVKHLFMQVASLKPEDSIQFSIDYFKRIQSCHHVLGAEYSFIVSCQTNRRAFIFCLMEAFQKFTYEEEMTTIEYQQLVEMICPDFPRKIITDAVAPLEASKKVINAIPKVPQGEFRIALFFYIVYEEWLKYIETIFREEGSLDCLSLFRLRAYLEDCRNNWSISFAQPPSAGVDATLANFTGSEIAFNAFLRALFSSKVVQDDVCTYPNKAIRLLEDVGNNQSAAIPAAKGERPGEAEP